MIFFILFVGLVLVFVKTDLAQERERLKTYSKDCEAELGEPINLYEKLKNGDNIGDTDKAGKMALCINIKMGHMDLAAETVPDLFTEYVFRLTDDTEKRTQIIETCGIKNGETPEETALNFVKCMQKFIPELIPK